MLPSIDRKGRTGTECRHAAADPPDRPWPSVSFACGISTRHPRDL